MNESSNKIHEVNELAEETVKLKAQERSLSEKIIQLEDEIRQSRRISELKIEFEKIVRMREVSKSEITQLQTELAQLNRELDETRDKRRKCEIAFLKKVAKEMPFPIEPEPQRTNSEFTFLFITQFSPSVYKELKSLTTLTGEPLQIKSTLFYTDKITVKAATQEEALKGAIEAVRILRDSAEDSVGILTKIDEIIKRIETSDKEKIALKTLYEQKRPLSALEIEDINNLGRGVMKYTLVDLYRKWTTPLVMKVDRGRYVLSELGKRVMDRYTETFGEAQKPETKVSTLNVFYKETEKEGHN